MSTMSSAKILFLTVVGLSFLVLFYWYYNPILTCPSTEETMDRLEWERIRAADEAIDRWGQHGVQHSVQHSVRSTEEKENRSEHQYSIQNSVRWTEKPLVLLWVFPDANFDFSDCFKYFNIDSCILTSNRSLYDKADAVIFYPRYIHKDLSNIPQNGRPPFQKWIWFHLESPTHTWRQPELLNLFNLTCSYRRDADITVRYNLLTRKSQPGEFVLPKKDKLVCWIMSNTGPPARKRIYYELIKHIKVDVFGNFAGKRLEHDKYYSTIARCKFYLAFENSQHRDYITEKMNGPLAAGTVPVVFGTSRENYEEFFPRDSFIHVDDFPNVKALAEFLHHLDQNDEMYLNYFHWRTYLHVTPHLLTPAKEFILPICTACDYMSRDSGYSVVHDLDKWYFV